MEAPRSIPFTIKALHRFHCLPGERFAKKIAYSSGHDNGIGNANIYYGNTQQSPVDRAEGNARSAGVDSKGQTCLRINTTVI